MKSIKHLKKIKIPSHLKDKLDKLVWPVLEPDDICCMQLTRAQIGPLGLHKHCSVGWLNTIAQSVGESLTHGLYTPEHGTVRQFLFKEFAKQIGRSMVGIATWNDSQGDKTVISEQLNLLGKRLGYTEPTQYKGQ